MADTKNIRPDMQVLGSDGGMVGTVDAVEAGTIKLKRAPELGGGEHHHIPTDWVARVDDHVHLSVDAATVRERWGLVAAAAGHPAAAASGGMGWLPWLLGLLALAAILFFGLKGCDGRDHADRDGVVADSAVAAGTFNRDVETYLASNEALPRTFTFDQLEFDTASAKVRPADQAGLNDLAVILVARPASRVRIVGFADARGDAPVNKELGMERAKAVAAALTAGGVAADRIETASGGEADPAASNATPSGQQANRRTELVVLAR